MSNRLWPFLALPIAAVVALKLVQLFYGLAKDSPVIVMRKLDMAYADPRCGNTHANIQTDTIVCCSDSLGLDLSLSFKAFDNKTFDAFHFTQDRYQKGKYRTYGTGGVGNGIGFTASKVDELGPAIYVGAYQMSKGPAANEWSFRSTYISISDDGSRLLDELKFLVPRQGQITLERRGSRVLLKIVSRRV